jgi:hypothetical protein
VSSLDKHGRARAEQVSAALSQGDLIATSVAVALEAPASSLLEDAHRLVPVDAHGIWAPAALEIASGWAAIVTQTCDAIREIDDLAHLQLMPVIALSEEEWSQAQNGRRGALFSIPPATDLQIAFPAIDCSISFPVSKAALAHTQVETKLTPLDPAARILLSSWLMRRVGRHAFPDDLEQHVLNPLRMKLTRSMGKNSQAGFLADCLLGVWSSTTWASGVSIYFILDENRLSSEHPSLDPEQAVQELIAPIHKALGKAGQSVQVIGTARTLAGVSAHELMMSHRQVDLDPLPTGAFAAEQAIAELSAEAAQPAATEP